MKRTPRPHPKARTGGRSSEGPVSKLRRVLETCLYSTDLAAARLFYRETLGLEPIAEEEGRHLFFRCGAAMLRLFHPEKTASGLKIIGGVPVPAHGARGPGNVAFRVEEAELEAWRKRLREGGVAVEAEIAWPKGGRSVYSRDPAGNSLEVEPEVMPAGRSCKGVTPPRPVQPRAPGQ